MRLPIHKGVLFALLFLSAVTLFVTVPEPVRFVAGALLASILPGFVLLLFLGERDRPMLDDVFLPILFSPIVLSLLVIAFHATGSSLEGSVRSSTLALLALLAVGLIRELRTNGPEPQSPARAIVVTCAVFGAAILSLYLINRFLYIRSDAWYHASIVHEILDRGFPPREPLLPDDPIRYMWIYHLSVASSSVLTRLDVFPGLALFNVLNALVFPYLVFRLTSFFSSRRRDLVWTPIFAVSGLASAAWILWPLGLLRAFAGTERGWGELMRLLRDIDIDSQNVIYFLSPFEKMSPLGNWMINVVDKFVTITPFAFALNLTLLTLITALSVGFGKRFALKPFLTAVVLILGALLFHVVGGAALVAAVIGSGALLAIHRYIGRRRETMPVIHVFALPGAALLACAAAFPYISSLMAGGNGERATGSFLHLGIWNVVTIILPLAILFVPASKAIREMFSLRTEALTILAAWTIPLLACNVFIDLALRNESKFIFPLFAIIFPPIVWKILDAIEDAGKRRRPFLIGWAALLFAVPPLLTCRGFVLDAPKTGVEERRYDVSPDDRLLSEWIAGNTAPRAVLIESGMCDMSPVFAHRRDFHPDAINIGAFGYDGGKLARYESIQRALLDGAQLAPEDMRVLTGIGSPVYIVLWEEDLDGIRRARAALDSDPDRFTLVFHGPAGLVYHVRGT